MPIVIEYSGEGKACFTAHCDLCRQPIIASESNLLFPKLNKNQCPSSRTEFYTVHKACVETLEKQLGYGRMDWMPFDAAVMFLLRNTQVQPRKAQRTADIIDGL